MRAPSRPYAFGSHKKVDDLLQLVLGLFHSSDVGKRHPGVLLNVDFCAALADGHQSAARTLLREAPDDKHPDSEEQQRR
jgi:hypothetical protein